MGEFVRGCKNSLTFQGPQKKVRLFLRRTQIVYPTKTETILNIINKNNAAIGPMGPILFYILPTRATLGYPSLGTRLWPLSQIMSQSSLELFPAKNKPQGQTLSDRFLETK